MKPTTTAYTTIHSSRFHLSKACAEAGTEHSASAFTVAELDHFAPCGNCVDSDEWGRYQSERGEL